MASFVFSPPFLFRNRHLQSVVGTLTRRCGRLPASEVWEVAARDGVVLRGKYWPGTRGRALVFIYHGLGGTPDSVYVTGAALALRRAGFHVVRMGLRGAEIDPPYTAAMYHAGVTEDFDTVVEDVLKKGFGPIHLLTFSLSANAALKWLGEGKRPVESLFAVSPPVRLSKAADLIDLPKNRIYQRYFLEKLRRTIRNKAAAHPEVFSRYDRPEFFTSLRAFDGGITAPFHGFLGADDYYEKNSSCGTLGKIANRAVIVHALDDPFIDSADLRELSESGNGNVETALFNFGGHAGFYGGPLRGYQVDRWAAEYFSR